MDEHKIRRPTADERRLARERGCDNGVSKCAPIGDAALVVVDERVMCTAHATWLVGSLISALGLRAALELRRDEEQEFERAHTRGQDVGNDTSTDEGALNDQRFGEPPDF